MTYTYAFTSHDYRDYENETTDNILTVQVPCVRSSDGARFYEHDATVTINLGNLPNEDEQWAEILGAFDAKLGELK
jgi:hypothetical protein